MQNCLDDILKNNENNQKTLQKTNQYYYNVPLHVLTNIDKISTNYNILNNQVLKDKPKCFLTQIVEKNKNLKKKNIHDKHIFQYKFDIDDIAKYVCYC